MSLYTPLALQSTITKLLKQQERNLMMINWWTQQVNILESDSELGFRANFIDRPIFHKIERYTKHITSLREKNAKFEFEIQELQEKLKRVSSAEK